MTLSDIRNYCGNIYAKAYVQEKERIEVHFGLRQE